MAEFTYNNAKNANISHTFFEFNYSYHLQASYKKNVNSCLQLKSAEKLASKLRKLMIVYKKNFQYAQRLQNQYYNKVIKPKSYTPSNKVWLNTKYIKTKQNRKLEVKFFKFFKVLHLVKKQVYKIELPKKMEDS